MMNQHISLKALYGCVFVVGAAAFFSKLTLLELRTVHLLLRL